MTITTTEIANEIISFVIDENLLTGFNSEIEYDGGSLIYRSNDIWLSFSFGVLSEMNGIGVGGLRANVAFPQLEKIVQPILIENDLHVAEVERRFSSFSFPAEYKNEIFPKKIVTTIQELTPLLQVIKQFTIEDVIPRFEKWKDLTKVYDYIMPLAEESEELEDCLGQFAPMKKAAIMRLCNDPNYPKYMETFWSEQQKDFKEDPDDIDNIRWYNATKELKEILDNTDPIYNL